MKIIFKDHCQVFMNNLKLTNNSLTLVAPFFTADMAYQIVESVNKNIQIILITRLDFESIQRGYFDLNAIKILREKFPKIRVYISKYLHAKIYVFDNKCALITSSNLTMAGLNRNIEYGIFLDNDPHIELIVNDINEIIKDSKNIEEVRISDEIYKRECQKEQKSIDDYNEDLNKIINIRRKNIDFTIPTGKDYRRGIFQLGDIVSSNKYLTNNGNPIQFEITGFRYYEWYDTKNDGKRIRTLYLGDNEEPESRRLVKGDLLWLGFYNKTGDWINFHISWMGYYDIEEDDGEVWGYAERKNGKLVGFNSKESHAPLGYFDLSPINQNYESNFGFYISSECIKITESQFFRDHFSVHKT